MANRKVITTQVAIMGSGPAGLMLSHLLAKQGIESTVIEVRSHKEISETVRAGILEHGSVNLLVDSGVSDRVLRDGDRHDGIELRFNGESHRIDFQDLVGESVWLYPQTDVFLDLAARRQADGGDVRYSVTDTTIHDLEGTPKVWFTDAEGVEWELQADFIAGADGSRSHSRFQIPEARRKWYFHEYPFAWFGILAEAPRSSEELIYANSENGFALISQRTDTVQRMYFQCDPNEDVNNWSDDRIWDAFRTKVNGNGFELKEGPVIDKTVLKFRSFVHAPMRHGKLFLAGDAAHTVPPTGAKGLNLALHDVKMLFEGLDSYYQTGNTVLLDAYSDRALDRVWKAQQFSYWMTSMLHTPADGDDFARARQLGELNSVVSSRHGRAYLAEAYTGWPGAH
ncbi:MULTISPECIES: 4-hydroxybenzoate 3-monooxygenase [unclassified Arthrobacter]|uniref:4-hydroxybenzoate 3-monooxygenase n=1 Tax=unclassified Arthrobacter TaxID=235627 RepID=UPI002E09E090|nr:MULTISPECIES: 4-hydroxybenzoate 3-monooxygenase [unclassified Arthrobacter]MEC5190732.1 p-hydroxybenzoate 3-monooxygenase [Arthrobacter sp. MP_M4]MEC5202816.1 p-hydroxybenzoate 3-monooxygenase [Arthrobacter sp. MP_M7]